MMLPQTVFVKDANPAFIDNDQQALQSIGKSAIAPWLIIAVTLCLFIFTVLTNHRTTDVITQAVSGLTPILLCVELIFTKHRTQS